MKWWKIVISLNTEQHRNNMLKINQYDIKRIVAESIRNILSEAPNSQFPVGSEEWRKWVLETFTSSNIIYWKAMHPEWSKEQCNNVVQLYEKVKQIYNSQNNRFEAYKKLMDELKMSEEELERNGITEILKEIDKQNEKWNAFNDGWY